MKKKLFFIIPGLLGLFLSACSGSSSPSTPSGGGSEPGGGGGSDPGGDPDPGPGPQVEQFTITFKDEEDNVLDSRKWDKDSIPSYTYNKDDTAEWDYTVEGWSSTLGGSVITIPAATEDATYWAVVSQEKRSYTVSFYKENGTQIKSDVLEFGAQPACDYTGPSDTDEFDYTFEGWSTSLGGQVLPVIPTVSGSASYYAKVSSAKKQYNVHFYDENSQLLTTISYAYGENPAYTYTKTDTDEWDYTVEGWSSTPGGSVLDKLPSVSGEASYYAIVSKVKQQYTITFVSNGDTSVSPITADYGTEVAKPGNPSKEGYHFTGWSSDQAGQNKVSWPVTLVKNETFYGNWNENVDLKGYFQTLLAAMSHDPYGYIPNSMKPEANIKELSNLEKDYSVSQNVNSIEFGGHGEQWNMVLTNLKQSETFYQVFSTGSEVITLASVVVNNWIDSDPSDIGEHEFNETQYKAKISYKNKVLTYTIQYKTGWNIPVVGEILPQIDMSYDITSGVKSFRIQLNSENAIKYVVSDGYYAFGMELKIEIAGKTGSRKAYFEINSDEDEGTVDGHIYEFLTYKTSEESEEKTVLPSCADFYIDEDYVSVVGNKASGLAMFEGFITELYDVDNGKLKVYKVEETFEKTFITVTINKTYNTLFFNLEDISGINSVKAVENGNVDPHENSHDIYVNGKDSKFVPTKNKYYLISTSRKYDIEMRKQYFYTLDSDNKPVKHEVLTPMMFIQDDGTESGETNYSTFENDISKDNSISAHVNLGVTYLNRVREDYLTLIPLFKENKDNQTSQTISEFIGEAEVIEA